MEVLSLTLSVISLFVAGFAAYLTYRLGRQQLHLLARHEYHKLLLELDRELMRDPALWGLYDNHEMARHRPVGDAAHTAKLEAFAFLKLNLLEMVFAFEREAGAMNQEDREFFEGWHGTCRDSVYNSALIRDIIDRPDCQEVFGKRFLAHLKQLKREWQQAQAARTAPAPSPAPVAAHV